MYIQLEQKDYDAIAEMIAMATGDNSIFYDDIIEVCYTVEGEGYREDDYYDGTGAYITTSIDVNISDVKCDFLDVRYNREKLIKAIKSLLWD
jgi:hypothetical protein